MNSSAINLLRVEAQSVKGNRKECLSCTLFDSTMVLIDTNAERPSPVDVVFVGLNPGATEKEQGLPFVGKAGKVLREEMQKLPEKTTWAITNRIFCFTRNESEIPSPGQVLKNCKNMFTALLKLFPAKIYVPLGAKAMSAFRIKEPVLSVSGVDFGERHLEFMPGPARVVPIIHPSAVFRPNKKEKTNREIFSDGIDNVVAILSETRGLNR